MENHTALITGASTGIGAVYADRFARRGYDLVLTARDAARLQASSEHLRRTYGVSVEIIVADLTLRDDLARVEARAKDDQRIDTLINNAGAVGPGGFLDQAPQNIDGIIALNVTAVAKLARAVAPRFAAAGNGAIINLGSVVGLAPEIGMSVYGATKAFVLFLSQGLQVELGPKGVYVQAVLPSATGTELWERSGRDVEALAAVMTTEDLVDAALVGFDRREPVTIPPFPDETHWESFETARKSMRPDFRHADPAPRYRQRLK